MSIQSLSIVVPTRGCVNNCKFCVSRMHTNDYVNNFDVTQIKKRIKYAVNNGINTCIITGTGEALQNREFLIKLREIFDVMDHPFPNVELQTSGVLLNEENIRLLKYLSVNTISLSVSDIFNSNVNAEIIGMPKKLNFGELKDVTKLIKDNGFNLRLSLNMTTVYDYYFATVTVARAKELGADQVTFRKLYHGNDDSSQSKWVKENACTVQTLDDIKNYIIKNGRALYRLPFGPMVYSIDGMSTVIDDDCMAKEGNEDLKYIILREDGKLYSQWDDKGALIF